MIVVLAAEAVGEGGDQCNATLGFGVADLDSNGA